MRIDKLLSHMGYGTRKEVKQLIQQGWVSVNGAPIKSVGLIVDEYHDEIKVEDQRVVYQKYQYLLMNKPQHVISATEDHHHLTVIDLLDGFYQSQGLFPVGRLDIDTTGLLLLTNNGQLAHQLLSPKKQVTKTYYALIDGQVTDQHVLQFAKGIKLEDFTTLPAQLHVFRYDRDHHQSEIEVTIQEGKFHQVKRMFKKIGCEVIELQRISMGPLTLPEDLLEGQYRPLTEEEKAALKPFGLE